MSYDGLDGATLAVPASARAAASSDVIASWTHANPASEKRPEVDARLKIKP
jgi:hypothetical protein